MMAPRGLGLLPMVGILGAAAAASARADEVLRPGFACYNPVSQVLKGRLWVQEAIGPGVQVPLQHAGRRLAQDRGDMDAGAGLGPCIALAEVVSAAA